MEINKNPNQHKEDLFSFEQIKNYRLRDKTTFPDETQMFKIFKIQNKELNINWYIEPEPKNRVFIEEPGTNKRIKSKKTAGVIEYDIFIEYCKKIANRNTNKKYFYEYENIYNLVLDGLKVIYLIMF